MPLVISAMLYLTITSCANVGTKKIDNNSASQWDFDHNIQFIQSKLADKYYQLEIIPNAKVNFSRLATFMLRKSYSLCGGYHYKLEMMQGIEGFDDKRAMPNYIFPSLKAKVECKAKLNKALNKDKPNSKQMR